MLEYLLFANCAPNFLGVDVTAFCLRDRLFSHGWGINRTTRMALFSLFSLPGLLRRISIDFPETRQFLSPFFERLLKCQDNRMVRNIDLL